MFPDSLEKEPTPGVLARSALDQQGERPPVDEAVDRVIAMIGEGRVGPWPPATSRLSAWMDAGREAAKGIAGEALESAIAGWRDGVVQALADEMEAGRLARQLEEWAWVRWQTEGLEAAGDLIVTADAVSNDENVHLRLAGARADALFAPFIEELRISATQPTDATSGAG